MPRRQRADTAMRHNTGAARRRWLKGTVAARSPAKLIAEVTRHHPRGGAAPVSRLSRVGPPCYRWTAVSRPQPSDARSKHQLSGVRIWGRRVVLLIHGAIIINFLFEIGYASFMVFRVLSPHGVEGPLWGQALSIPHDLLVARRLYAIEGWIAIAGLTIYLAITEIAPRLAAARATRQPN